MLSPRDQTMPAPAGRDDGARLAALLRQAEVDSPAEALFKARLAAGRRCTARLKAIAAERREKQLAASGPDGGKGGGAGSGAGSNAGGGAAMTANPARKALAGSHALLDRLSTYLRKDGDFRAALLDRMAGDAELRGMMQALAAKADAIEAGDMARENPVTVRAVIVATAAMFNTTRDVLVSARRTAEAVLPRHLAMFLAHDMTRQSLPQIGRMFGGRDHTTVLHAVRRIGAMLESDADLAATADVIRRVVQETGNVTGGLPENAPGHGGGAS